MANDCLVTKLKSQVNNDNLLKIGELVIINSDNRSGQIVLRAYSGTIAVTTYQENGAVVNTYSVGTSNQTIPIASTEKKISISDKYNLRTFDVHNLVLASVNLEDLLYSADLATLNCSTNAWLTNHIFEIADVKKLSSMVNLSIINSYNVLGTLEDIATHPNAANIEILEIKETSIEGTLNTLTSMSKLVLLDIISCTNIVVTRSALNALEAQNCTVRYNQTVIEDV